MSTTKEITKALGGNRLGSGSKMDVKLHKYNRSNHDLSFAWRTSAQVGTLIPCLKKIALPGDTWSIDIESIVRTMPATGPLYGSYKMQIDVFECPIRLYNGLLHNNMTKIGMNMNQVILPAMELTHEWRNPTKYSYDINNSQIATDSLIGYLGLRGISDVKSTNNRETISRTFNAVPVLAYWDIYKNYYANKQEENGRFVGVKTQQEASTITWLAVTSPFENYKPGNRIDLLVRVQDPYSSTIPQGITINEPQYGEILEDHWLLDETWTILTTEGGIEKDPTMMEIVLQDVNNSYTIHPILTVFPNITTNAGGGITLGVAAPTYRNTRIKGIGYAGVLNNKSQTEIVEFPLSNIDDARIYILQSTGLGSQVKINNMQPPYSSLTMQDSENNCINKYSQYGLALKTYQSDLLNNWLRTEWIEGPQGINEITKIDTSSGSFTMDALNLARKVYNMLNRIAVSGGSYEDYIEAVYSTEITRRAESPIYCGGASYEVVFEEIVSQSAATDEPLGTLAGKGTITNKKGGNIEIRVEEPAYIMAIMSITPRLDYSQGNDWDMTELSTMDDLHKPELDGIGFEDLLQERAAWWGHYVDATQQARNVNLAMGKSPAWINYMTSINETHGTFAIKNNTMWMTLNRQYEYYYEKPNGEMGIKDPTTYVDPSKYNYIFADTTIDAQNFWIQIGWRLNVRRVMSAKIIPQM